MYVRLANQDKLDAADTLISNGLVYHRSCFLSYTSKINLVHIECGDELSAGTSEQYVEVNISGKKPTRSSLSASLTDWSVCLLCNKKCYRNNRKLHKIDTDERSDILIQAAERLHDNDFNQTYDIIARVSCIITTALLQLSQIE